MRGLLLTLLVLAPAAVGAQSADGWPAEVERTVRAQVAHAWSLAPEQIVLEWGSVPSGLTPPGGRVELTGSGSGGYWVARIDDEGGEAPVAVRIRAGHHVRRSVAARRLERGHELAPDDMTVEERVVWGPPRGGRDAAPGWVTQRVVQRGSVLEEPTVRPPRAVAPGAPVELVLQSGPVRLRLAGEAAGAGSLGEQVYVRTESGARLRGVIVAPGVVDVSSVGPHALQGGAW